MIGSDATAVLPERLIANPVQPVLDTPMTTVEFEQSLGIRFLARQRCNPVGHFRRGAHDACLAIARGTTSRDTEHLLNA